MNERAPESKFRFHLPITNMAGVISSEPKRKFVTQPNTHLYCTICRTVYTHPVINVQCGHTFCRACVSNGDDNTEICCPKDSETVSVTALVPNRALEAQIDDLEMYCPNALVWCEETQNYAINQESCKAIIHFRDMAQHEVECEYGLVPCPVNPARCGSIRRHQVTAHPQHCTHVICPNNATGCSFIGSKELVDHHVLLCPHSEQLTSLNPRQVQLLLSSHHQLQSQVENMASQMSTLQANYTELMDQNTKLTHVVEQMAEKYNSLELKFDKQLSTKISPSRDTRRRLSSGGGGMVRSPSSSFSSLTNGSVEKWVMPFQFKCIGTLRGHSGSVWSLVRHNNFLFSAGGDQSIKLWNITLLAKGCERTLTGHTDRIQCMAVGEQYLYSGGADKAICAWSLTDFTLVKTVNPAHDNIIAAMVVCDNYLFSSSHTIIKVWDASSMEEVHSIAGLHHWVRSLVINATKDKLYSGSHNTIEVWDCQGKFNLKSKISHSYGSAHAMSVTSQHIVVGTYNNNTHVFDVTTHEHLMKLTGHVGTINATLVSPSGRFLFTGSSDCSVQLWNLENMLPIQKLSRHDDSVNTLALNGDLLFTGSEDTEIKVFRHFKMDMGNIDLVSLP